MYCPNCGTQTSNDQRFCRECGMNMAPVSQMLSGESLIPAAPAGVARPPNGRREIVDEGQKYKRLGFILFWSGIMLAALLGIVGDAISSLSWRLGHLIENLAGLGGIVVLAGLGMMIFSRFFTPVRESERAGQRAIQPPPAIFSNPGKRPDASLENKGTSPPPSVTDHTTYTLDQQIPGSTRRH